MQAFCLFIGRLQAQMSHCRSNMVKQARRLGVLVFLGKRFIGSTGDVLGGNLGARTCNLLALRADRVNAVLGKNSCLNRLA